jgi:hypothetical protein
MLPDHFPNPNNEEMEWNISEKIIHVTIEKALDHRKVLGKIWYGGKWAEKNKYRGIRVKSKLGIKEVLVS